MSAHLRGLMRNNPEVAAGLTAAQKYETGGLIFGQISFRVFFVDHA